jgi:hypothetical protein
MPWKWRWRRRSGRECSGDARPDPGELLERVRAQEPRVDDVVSRIERRVEQNTFREWWDEAMKPRPHLG